MIERTVLVVSLLAAALVLQPGPALAQLEGRYKTQGQRVSVQVKTWGEDCGARPRSYSSGGGKVVEIRRVGPHLSIGSQRTDRCWSRNPRVQRLRATIGSNRWFVVCETAATDPRFEHGEYSVEQVNETTLRLREESRYNWRLEGDHCQATVVLTRTYVRLADEDGHGVEPDGPSSGPPAAPPPLDDPPDPGGPSDASRCAGSPGPPVKLEVHPGRARIEPGERVCFRAVGRDREGCPVPVTASWSKSRSGTTVGGAGGRVGPDGCYTAASSIVDAEGRVVLVASSGELRAQTVVSVRIPDISDLIAARLEEGADEPGPGIEPQVIEARPGAVQGVGRTGVAPVGERRNLLMVILLGGLAAVALLALVAVVIKRRSKPVDDEQGRDSPSEDPATEVVADPAPGSVSVGGGERVICPKCRRGFEPTAKFCPNDAIELVPYSEWRKSRLEDRDGGARGRMICPSCASRYEPGTLFCEKDGTKLEPVN